MSAHLSPCSACARHVRASERTCPFCRAPLPERTVGPAVAAGRLSRAALFAFGTTALAGAIVGCGGAQQHEETTAPAYGGPPEPEPGPATPSETTNESTPPASTPDDPGGAPAAAYGGPPMSSPGTVRP